MGKLFSFDEDTRIMADDLSRWSGLSVDEAVHRAVQLIWHAVTVRDAALKKWVLVLQRTKGVLGARTDTA
jgi:hypothetical protein